MQLCVNVQIPESTGGIHGAAVYIDTRGDFDSHVVRDMVDALIEKLNEEGTACLCCPTADEFLDRIFCIRVYDDAEQHMVLRQMRQFLVDHPEVKLIVFDSISHHLSAALRRKDKIQAIERHTYTLLRFAAQFNIAVVVLSTPLVDVRDVHYMMEWDSAPRFRILLEKSGDESIMASCIRSPQASSEQGAFVITNAGSRDTMQVNQTLDVNEPKSRKLTPVSPAAADHELAAVARMSETLLPLTNQQSESFCPSKEKEDVGDSELQGSAGDVY
ncbi:hypothetical protein HKX48_003885 [Thoreauomyces humboldtii]|nr:hypothetical protein HKX48_003885 [Thoreauomyces humboldtii]